MGVDASVQLFGIPSTPVKPYAYASLSPVLPTFKSPLRRCLFGTPDPDATSAFLRSQLSLLFKDQDSFFAKYEIIHVIRKERKRWTPKKSKQKLITDYFNASKSQHKLTEFFKRFPTEEEQDTRCIS